MRKEFCVHYPFNRIILRAEIFRSGILRYDIYSLSSV